jgi:hypothetical protein
MSESNYSDFGAKKIDLTTIRFTPELLRCIPAHVVRQYRAVPVFDSPKCLTVAVNKGFNIDTTDSLSHLLKRDLSFVTVEDGQLDQFIERLYKEAE